MRQSLMDSSAVLKTINSLYAQNAAAPADYDLKSETEALNKQFHSFLNCFDSALSRVVDELHLTQPDSTGAASEAEQGEHQGNIFFRHVPLNTKAKDTDSSTSAARSEIARLDAIANQLRTQVENRRAKNEQYLLRLLEPVDCDPNRPNIMRL
eukprot:GEZU01008087.1.p1 GENE.GEZU01008087.1~~GEZU01008087.1.p1  ORF type:complete len:153 (-),score=13.03 GEZU01008087.1:21-479(-)